MVLKFITFSLVVFAVLQQQIESQTVSSCNQCRYGECEQNSNSVSCHCVMGVQGTYCDRLLANGENICFSNPCWNGGKCVNLVTSYQCQCQSGFTGVNCRTVTTANNGYATTSNPGFVTYPPVQTVAPVSYTNPPAVTFPPVNPYTVAPAVTFPPVNPYTAAPVVTFPPVVNPNTFPPVTPGTTTTQRVLYDKKVVINNKGGYTAWLEAIYYNPTKTVQTGQIASGQSYAFYIPGSVDLNVGDGVVINAYALGGNTVFSQRATTDPQCYDIWGTTLNSQWTSINC